MTRSFIALSVSAISAACEPTVIVGARVCPESSADGGVPMPDPTTAVDVPWTTGFEEQGDGGFCDYALPQGFCFATGSGSYTVVTSPVHSGQHAAAFSVRTDVAGGGQVRCVQQGIFPVAAYYGAWYYVPALATNRGNWNLLHFQGAAGGQPLHNIWDVSLVNLSDGGGLGASFLEFLPSSASYPSAAPPIPVGRWFHLEVYFRRAKDKTGEISVRQDGVTAVHLTNLVTDDSDWGQWYVGNLADALLPPASTLYVDDVTIGSTP